MLRDAVVLKMQREVCHSKCVRKVSGLSRKGPLGSNFMARKNSVQQNWCVGFVNSPIRPTSSDMLKVLFVWRTKMWGKKRERCGYRYHRLGHFSPLSVICIFVGCWTIRRQSYALAKGVQYVIISVYYFNHHFCRPLIQNKLEVLGKAGLSEEELDADCTFFKVSGFVLSLSLERIHRNLNVDFGQLQRLNVGKQMDQSDYDVSQTIMTSCELVLRAWLEYLASSVSSVCSRVC